MRRIKLTLEYDGEAYVGWQIQPNGVSVQARLQEALARLLGGEVRVDVAGRTDAGVHAFGQVACFSTPRDLPLQAYEKGLAAHLPKDIAVVRVEEVPPGFDPRRDSHGKRYRYLVFNGPQWSPLRRRTHWQIFQPLDVEAMGQAARCLLGRHDFSAFRAANCEASTTDRTLRKVDVQGEPGGDIRFTVEGTAFLKHMVRNIVGTLVEVGRARRPTEWVSEVLASKDRTRSGQTAPAHGLALEVVFYAPGHGPRER